MLSREKIRIFFFLSFCFLYHALHSDIQWSAPATISTANVNASSPQIVIDSSGNATAVWIENNEIKASTHPVNGTWSASTTLSNVLNTASAPKLGVDSNGNITALWLESGLVSGIVNSATTTAGIWGVGVPVSNALGGASAPALSVDASGNAVAVWVRNNAIESATRSSGVWGTVSTLSTSTSDGPQAAISANGTVISVWHSVVSSADVIMSATKTLGGNWNTAKSVFSGIAALKHNYPKVAIDANGNAALVWFRYNLISGAYENVTVLTSSLTFNASAWTIPAFLSQIGIRNPADFILKVAFDGNGNAVAFWTNSYDGQMFWIEEATMLFGGSWGTFVQPYSPSLYTLAADIAINSLGDALTTYMYFDGSSLKIQSQETDIANPLADFWTAANVVSQGVDNGYPSCAITLTGNVAHAAVVWINYNGTNSVIQTATGSENVLSPPTTLKVVQNQTNFGIYHDYVNTFSWQASPSSNIQQYNIFRNGIFFTFTDSNTFQIVDHNNTQNGSVTYGVAAVNNTYSQSSIATVSFP